MPEQRECHARGTGTGKKALPAAYPDGDNGHLYIPAAQEAALLKDAKPPTRTCCRTSGLCLFSAERTTGVWNRSVGNFTFRVEVAQENEQTSVLWDYGMMAGWKNMKTLTVNLHWRCLNLLWLQHHVRWFFFHSSSGGARASTDWCVQLLSCSFLSKSSACFENRPLISV